MRTVLNKLTPVKSWLFFIGFIIPPIAIVISAFCYKKIDAQQGALLINAYSLLAGVYYFFRRLEYDKICLLIKHRRERLDQLKQEFLTYDKLAKGLIRNTFSNTEALSFHKNNIQSCAATIITLLEISEQSRDISAQQVKTILKLLSFVENDASFTGDLSVQSKINSDQYLMRYGYNYGPAKEIIFTLISDSENQHLKI